MHELDERIEHLQIMKDAEHERAKESTIEHLTCALCGRKILGHETVYLKDDNEVVHSKCAIEYIKENELTVDDLF